MSIRCLTFDLDDTLWPFKPIIINAEQQVSAFFAKTKPQWQDTLTPKTFQTIRTSLLADKPELAVSLTQLRTSIYHQALKAAGATKDEATTLSEQAVEVFLTHRSNVTYFPETIEIIKRLSKNHLLGVITNGNVRFTQLSIANYFSFYLSAEQTGISKPSKGIFTIALNNAQQLNPSIQRADQICHIGDSHHYDMQGATNAGFKSIWLNKDEEKLSKTDTQPSAQIQQLNQLEDALKKLS